MGACANCGCGDCGLGARDVHRLLDIGRGRQPVRLGRRRQQVRGRRRPAIAARAGIGRAVIGEIEMEVVVVEHVGAWPEHRREIAGRRRRGPRAGTPIPGCRIFFQSRTIEISRPSASLKPETSIALPNACSESFPNASIVDRAAAIGAEHFEFDDRSAEPGLRDRLHRIVEPGLERRDHRAVDDDRLRKRDRAVLERIDLERMGHAANAGAADLRHRLDVLRGLHIAMRQAIVLGLSAPGRTLGALELAAAAERQQHESHSRGQAIRNAPFVQVRAISLSIAEPWLSATLRA